MSNFLSLVLWAFMIGLVLVALGVVIRVAVLSALKAHSVWKEEHTVRRAPTPR
ncbi:hypothetical protein [Microbacterium sp.]|uniref:hypothetical protein n=1 Tax=Microbacterium sp. TaxID=51671 RepID=UPI0039E5934C